MPPSPPKPPPPPSVSLSVSSGSFVVSVSGRTVLSHPSKPIALARAVAEIKRLAASLPDVP